MDEVSILVRVASENVKTAEADLASETGERLRGVFESNSHIIKILDVPELFATSIRQQLSWARAWNQYGRHEVERDNRDRCSPTTFGHVRGSRPEYALPLDSVREIVETPEGPSVVPGGDEAVRGVMAYRDGVLPLLSVRNLLALPSTTASREQALIVAVGGVLIGFVADRVRAVLSIEPHRLEPTPPVLAARTGGETQIKEIYRASHQRHVSILAPERLFREEIMQKLLQGDATMKPSNNESSAQSRADELRFLAFRLRARRIRAAHRRGGRGRACTRPDHASSEDPKVPGRRRQSSGRRTACD